MKRFLGNLIQLREVLRKGARCCAALLFSMLGCGGEGLPGPEFHGLTDLSGLLDQSGHDLTSVDMTRSGTQCRSSSVFRVSTIDKVYPTGLLAADFDRDGLFDVAIWGGRQDSERVYLQRPRGVWTIVDSLGVGTVTGTGDFNGDGLMDFLSWDWDAILKTETMQGRIIENLGGARFRASQEVLDLGQIGPSVFGDFDRDGDLDIVRGDYRPRIHLLRNDGGGMFPEKDRLDVLQKFLFPGRNVPHDMDGDGAVDIVGAYSRSLNGVIGILWSPQVVKGNFMFPDPKALPANDADDDVAVGELTGDKAPDIASVGGGVISIHRNLGGRAFSLKSYLFPGTYFTSVAVADFDGDGADDIVAGSSALAPRLVVMLSRPGGFECVDFPIDWYVGDLVVADFTGDKRPDIVTARAEKPGPDQAFVYDKLVLLTNLGAW